MRSLEVAQPVKTAEIKQVTGHKVITLSAGTNVFKLRWVVGSGTATLDSRALSAIVLGN